MKRYILALIFFYGFRFAAAGTVMDILEFIGKRAAEYSYSGVVTKKEDEKGAEYLKKYGTMFSYNVNSSLGYALISGGSQSGKYSMELTGGFFKMPVTDYKLKASVKKSETANPVFSIDVPIFNVRSGDAEKREKDEYILTYNFDREKRAYEINQEKIKAVELFLAIKSGEEKIALLERNAGENLKEINRIEEGIKRGIESAINLREKKIRLEESELEIRQNELNVAGLKKDLMRLTGLEEKDIDAVRLDSYYETDIENEFSEKSGVKLNLTIEAYKLSLKKSEMQLKEIENTAFPAVSGYYSLYDLGAANYWQAGVSLSHTISGDRGFEIDRIKREQEILKIKIAGMEAETKLQNEKKIELIKNMTEQYKILRKRSEKEKEIAGIYKDGYIAGIKTAEDYERMNTNYIAAASARSAGYFELLKLLYREKVESGW